MKSIQKHKISLVKKLLLAIFVVAVVIGISVASMYFTKTEPFFKNSANTTQTKTNDNNTPASSTSTSKTPVSNQPTNNNTKTGTLSASISYIRQTDTELQIGTLIEDITSEGDCKLTMTKDGKNVTDTVGVQALASSSTCKGFDEPIIELSKGIWNINIDITVGPKTANLVDSVTIN